MKSIRLRHPPSLDNLVLRQNGVAAAPERGEIQVRIRASSLNFHDLSVVTGRLRVADGLIPLSDGAGEVVAVGEGVDCWSPGDIVMSRFFPDWPAGPPVSKFLGNVPGDHVDGFAREFVTLPAGSMTRAPAGYSACEAATLVCAGLTAWRALVTDGPVAPGQTVLIQGSGGVSVFALQFAKMMGARVVATSSSDAKLAQLGAMGADHLINYRSIPEWGRAVREATGGRGVDHVVDVGGAGSLAQSIKACCLGGHIAVIGVLAGVAAPVSTLDIMARQIRVQGLAVGNASDQEQMIRAIEINAIHPVIDRHFPLEQLADAFRYQQAGAHFGKICVDI